MLTCYLAQTESSHKLWLTVRRLFKIYHLGLPTTMQSMCVCVWTVKLCLSMFCSCCTWAASPFTSWIISAWPLKSWGWRCVCWFSSVDNVTSISKRENYVLFETSPNGTWTFSDWITKSKKQKNVRVRGDVPVFSSPSIVSSKLSPLCKEAFERTLRKLSSLDVVLPLSAAVRNVACDAWEDVSPSGSFSSGIGPNRPRVWPSAGCKKGGVRRSFNNHHATRAPPACKRIRR